jgi:hypothetical protein
MHRRTAVLALAGAAASGVAIALSRLGVRARNRSGSGSGSGAGTEVQEYTCDCGQVFRVVGSGRHRVYWLVDASENDPVLEAACPNCERALPRDQDLETATATAAGGRSQVR